MMGSLSTASVCRATIRDKFRNSCEAPGAQYLCGLTKRGFEMSDSTACGLRVDRTASEILSEEYLPVRHLLLEIGAALDRVERGQDPAAAVADARWQQLEAGIRLLLDRGIDRAEAIQNLFSLE